MTQQDLALEQATPGNSLQYLATTRRGDYLVQVSWPLAWGSARSPPPKDAAADADADAGAGTKADPEEEQQVSTVYLLDGNAYFFTANDVARRMECTDKTRTIVVGIGYPPSQYVFDIRRHADFTAKSSDGVYHLPGGGKGTDKEYGGASDFLDVIVSDIVPHVEKTLFPKVAFTPKNRVLWGHSYGGLFALNALFTRPELFGTFVAASPSICWNNGSLIREQEAAFHKRKASGEAPPRLVITYGSDEQNVVRYPRDSDEWFQRKKDYAEAGRMKDNAVEMCARLRKSEHVHSVHESELVGEEHGGAATCALQRGLFRVLMGFD